MRYSENKVTFCDDNKLTSQYSFLLDFYDKLKPFDCNWYFSSALLSAIYTNLSYIRCLFSVGLLIAGPKVFVFFVKK